MSKPKGKQKEKTRRQFNPAGVRQSAVDRMKLGCNVSALAEELDVNRATLYFWKRKFQQDQQPGVAVAAVDPTQHRIQELVQKVAEQDGAIGRQTLENRFFQRCLASNRGVTSDEKRTWRECIYEEIRIVIQAQGKLTIERMERMCQLTTVSRAGYYRFWEEKAPREAEMSLRDAIQKAVLAHRHYGYRRITEVLKREGWVVGQKLIRRLMREDNLLAIRKRKFVRTTASSEKSVQ